MSLLGKMFAEKVAANPRPDSPEDGAIVDTVGWLWHYRSDGSYWTNGDDSHRVEHTVRFDGTLTVRTHGGFLLSGWWILDGDTENLINGSATYTEALQFAWQRITGKEWPREPTKTELARKEIVNALDEIELVIGERLDTWNSDYCALVGAREALEKALEHLS